MVVNQANDALRLLCVMAFAVSGGHGELPVNRGFTLEVLSNRERTA
jgi:hypothetical protein